jgi:hypothetical protein
MPFSREIKEHFHRPSKRRLINLTNTELSLLFKLRADEIAKDLDGHVFWEDARIVYWDRFIDLQDALFEVMLEIQSRYPASEVKEWNRLLPVVEPCQD